MEKASNLLGRGITFPFVLVNGAVKVDDHPKLIDESIRSILSWGLGQRSFLPAYYSKLPELLGEPNDLVVASLARLFIVEAISTWETRITLLEVTIGMPTASKLTIQLHYRINATRQVKEFNFQYQL